MIVIFWIAAVCLAAFVIWLLIDPLRIILRAPDHGDPFVLKIRHTAVKFDAWLASDLTYGIVGHCIGIPFDTRTIRRFLRKRPKTEKAKVEKEKKPGKPWAEIALARRRTLLKTVKIEKLVLDLEYGFGDPVTTGLVAGAIWQICMVLPENVHIDSEPLFTEERFSIEGEARIALFPWRVIVAGLSLAIGGLTWRTRTEKASSSPDPERRSSLQIPAPVPPPSPSSRS